jgi:aminopeptidase N
MNVTELKNIIAEAQLAARESADRYFKTELGGVDQMACGFAWVNIYEYAGEKIRGNTRIGKALKAAGVRQDYTRTFQIWNPSGYPVQNVDTLEAGARAAAEVFKQYGFTAYAGSRLD